MTDVTNNTAPATTATTTESSTNPSTTAPTKPTQKSEASKPKNKSKRRPQRRRAAVSDNDSSANEDGNDSASSASSHSDPADSEDDEPEVAEAKPSVFPDVSSITPAGWKKGDKAGATISFEDFEAGKEPPAPARGTGLAIKGRGGKAKVEVGQKREYTPEETARYEAQKAKRKEKQKAKKAELREKAIKAKEAQGKDIQAAVAYKPANESSTSDKPTPEPTTKPATTQPSKAKGKKKTEQPSAPSNPVAEVTASTSALKLDDPAPEPAKATETAPTTAETAESPTKSKRGLELLPNKPQSQDTRPQRGPQANQGEAFAKRTAEDPKVTPRVGQFWTHDQRLEGGNPADGNGNNGGPRQMPFWQGRGMPRGGFRGGFRGRGRGFFPNGPNGAGRGGFVNGGPPRPVELQEESMKEKEEGGSMLAMDREFELAEARDKKSRSTPQVVTPPAPVDAAPESTGAAPVKPPTAPLAERKWGHEAYETMGNADQFRGFRGRGRGMRARGGFFPRVHHLPFHPSAIAAQNAAAAKAAAAGLTPPTTAQPKVASTSAQEQPATASPVAESAPGETVATQPTADSLLDAGDEAVKVKFPGSEGTVFSAAPTPAPASVPAASTPNASSAPEAESSAPAASATVAKEVSHEAQYPTLHSASPGPVAAFQAQMYTGGSNDSPFLSSESGSAGSGHFARHQQNGNGNGQFYAPGMNASGEFVPSSMQPQQQQRPNFRQPMQHGYSPQFQHQQQPGPYSPGPYGHQGSPQAGPSYIQQGPPMGSPQYFQGPSNGYANGRNSPLNPYMNNGNQVGGYFSPARSASKVAIRAPRPEGESNGSPHQSNGHGDGNGNGNGQQQRQQQQGTYYPQHYNPYVQPFVPGQNGGQQRQETVYYPTNDQQYGWQGQGYGEQGYYDANGSYGY